MNTSELQPRGPQALEGRCVSQLCSVRHYQALCQGAPHPCRTPTGSHALPGPGIAQMVRGRQVVCDPQDFWPGLRTPATPGFPLCRPCVVSQACQPF